MEKEITEPKSQKFRDLIQTLLLSDHTVLFKSPEQSERITFPETAIVPALPCSQVWSLSIWDNTQQSYNGLYKYKALF